MGASRIPINFGKDNTVSKNAGGNKMKKTSPVPDTVDPESEHGQEKSSSADTCPADDPAALKLQYEELRKRSEELEALNKDYLEHLRRLQAEFENYKRRTAKEKAETIKFAAAEVAKRLLEVADNLQRGLNYAAGSAADKEILNGIRMVERQLLDLLSDYGVRPFDSLGKTFDPNRHDPVYTIERADVEENKVVEETEKGYTMHDKILRAAKVVVSRKPAGHE